MIRDALGADFLDALSMEIFDYDVIVVNSTARGYSRIKRLDPDVVAVIVVRIDGNDVGSCQLLTMLTLDRELSRIPVVFSRMSWSDTGGTDRLLGVSTRPH